MTPFAGHLSLSAELGARGETYLARQSFRAPFHLSKPYWDGHALIVQIVNPTAGILAGDVLELDMGVGSKASVLLTSPSASRVFQMHEGEAQFRQSFKVAAEGWLEVMPEPLVLHRGSRFRQSTEIDVADNGRLFFVDLLMPGRLARGEVWAWESLKLELLLRVAGEPILRERLDLSGAQLKQMAQFAGAGEGACFANVVMVSKTLAAAGEWKDQLAALHNGSVWAGISELRGSKGAWSLKLVAPDNLVLRSTLKTVRQIMRPFLPGLESDPRKL
jgi:urease accessory protein